MSKDPYLERAKGSAAVVATGADPTEPSIAQTAAFPFTCGVGDTPQEAITILHEIIADTIEVLESEGRSVPAPLSNYTGILHLRVPKSLHQALALRAESEGSSLIATASTILAEALAQPIGKPRKRPRATAR